MRKALWMVVLNAVRCNPWLRQYYERLRAAGKPGKVAVIAAMRKLLTAVWSVATHRKPFVPHLPWGACPTRRGDERGLMNSRYLAQRTAPMRACVGAEPRERRGGRGRSACVVYGALEERLIAKALRPDAMLDDEPSQVVNLGCWK